MVTDRLDRRTSAIHQLLSADLPDRRFVASGVAPHLADVLREPRRARPAREPAGRPGRALIDREDHARREAYARRTSRACLPRWMKPPRVLPVARCSRSSGTSTTCRPLRSASMVIPVSMPNAGANGSNWANTPGRIARWPDIGASMRRPVARWIAQREPATAKPKPPPTRRAKVAIARSAKRGSGVGAPDAP